jgi:hypothetical protein
MSGSLAAFRNQRGDELKQLAEEHLQHEFVNKLESPDPLLTLRSLNQSDRDLLKSAGSKVSTYAGVGSIIGIGLGAYFAFRLRSMRMAYFKAFRAMEKPIEVRFADGRTGRLFRACDGHERHTDRVR